MKVLKSIKVKIKKRNSEFWNEHTFIGNDREETPLSVATRLLNTMAFRMMKDPQFINVQADEWFDYDASGESEYCKLIAFIYGELKDPNT